MLLEGKFLEFHRYVSSHNLPLEAISDAYGARHRAGGQIGSVVRADVRAGVCRAACARAAVGDGDRRGHARMKDAVGGIGTIHHIPQHQRVVPACFIGGVAHLQHAAAVAAAVLPG